MQITMVWDECRFLNGEWGNRSVRSYWLQAERAELDKILAHAPKPEDLQAQINQIAGSDSEIYFLVSENLESIMALPSHYPVSGQWNGASPFREVTPRDITDLSELAAYGQGS